MNTRAMPGGPTQPSSGDQQWPLPAAVGLGLPCAVNAARQGFHSAACLSGRAGVATPPSLPTGNALRETMSPQMLALEELDFGRRFLVFAYLAGKKIEEVLEDVNYIRYLKSLPMDCFESEIWNKFGKKSLPAEDRRKNLDWDQSKTRLYYCNVEKRHDDSIVTTFKGPYVRTCKL